MCIRDRINRASLEKDEASNHPSEVALDHIDWREWDAIIHNNSTLDYLEGRVYEILE